jgi:hypothetical protein
MAGRRTTRGGPPRPTATSRVRTLERRLARLARELDAERERQARRLAALRRAQDRRLTALMREIAELRHHEARAHALTRLISERDAALAGQAERITHLETLLQRSSETG